VEAIQRAMEEENRRAGTAQRSRTEELRPRGVFLHNPSVVQVREEVPGRRYQGGGVDSALCSACRT